MYSPVTVAHTAQCCVERSHIGWEKVVSTTQFLQPIIIYMSTKAMAPHQVLLPAQSSDFGILGIP